MRIRRGKEDRRRYPRWLVALVGDLHAARVTPIHDVTLINISTGGALVEHLNPVRPGTTLFLNFLFIEKRMGLKCQVVRSAAHRSQPASNGERDVIYRTGLEFLGTLELIRTVNGGNRRPPH
ncbi:MAG: PilZ domain-containing protein [Candidatus Methylomirabilales bacterium]